MKHIITISLFFISVYLHAQYENEKRDYNWQLGFSTILDENGDYTIQKRKFILDFSDDSLHTYNDTLPVGHIYANAVMSDSEGQLLFFSKRMLCIR